jgi:MoaA/NifB/PqqE/SkfB family radical SAM enzyme
MDLNSDPYSPFKIVHHPDKLDQMRRGQQPIPLQVQLIISDLCNHSCNFCAYRLEGYTSNQNFGVKDPVTEVVNNNPNRMIPYEKCIEILDDCVEMGIPAIQITGGGEPTVHPKATEIFCAVLERNLDLAVVTNGTLVPDKMLEPLSRATWIRVSLDAGTENTYAWTRKIPKSFFGKTWSNVRRIAERKSEKTILGVGFVVTRDNYDEIYKCAALAKEHGADNFRISAVFTQDDFEYHKPHFEAAAEMGKAVVRDFSAPGFKVFNLFDDRINDLKQQRPDYSYCSYMNLNVYVGGDLTLYRCCNLAYNDRGKYGSVAAKRFKDVWASVEKQEDFKKFDARGCDRCMFNNKNRFINYVISPEAAHINYI